MITIVKVAKAPASLMSIDLLASRRVDGVPPLVNFNVFILWAKIPLCFMGIDLLAPRRVDGV